MSKQSRRSACDGSALAARWRWQRGPASLAPRGRCCPTVASLGWLTWFRSPTSTTSLATAVGVELRQAGDDRITHGANQIVQHLQIQLCARNFGPRAIGGEECVHATYTRSPD